MLGMHGNYAPNILTNEADLIIAIGMRFDDRVTGKTSEYAKHAKVIHIEIDQAEIDKIIKADVAVMGDAKQVLEQLLPLVNEREHADWLKKFRNLNQVEYEKVIEKDIHPDTDGLKMAEVVHLVSEKTKGDAIVVADVGQNQMMAARYYKFVHSHHFITSGGLGTMGFGLPASFGASIAAPDKTVVLFVGDGGLQMTIQELATIAEHKANVKIVLLNNSFLGMVRQWQQLFNDKRYSFTTMHNPDLAKVADAFGVESLKVKSRADLGKAIDTMLSKRGPFLLDVEVEKEDNVFPMVPPNQSVSNMILEASK
jgi:acetolactate synthase-1/2/3 large subunit